MLASCASASRPSSNADWRASVNSKSFSTATVFLGSQLLSPTHHSCDWDPATLSSIGSYLRLTSSPRESSLPSPSLSAP
ncbi:hypothetical protein T03_5459 [Trichinella britovi]|uniref:Uncharacterized protein n=1 Tax=Trichinella britovi TaxID=45882 RepID=A0A0V0YZM8_TRIBR|nr:hypothetical protein T03_5459 [Trichinella britovi]